MKSIYLVRHSYTEYSYEKKDINRALTQEGFERITTQINLIKSNFKPDIIVSSSALRAQQTALEFKKQLKINSEILFLDWLYEHYTTQDLLDLFQSFPNTINSIMLIAHNPTISVMATNFNHSMNYQFNPCSILKLDFEVEQWNSLDIRAGKENFFLD